MLKKIKQFLFKNTTSRQTIAKNTFWLSVSNFGGRFLRSIIIIYAARVLGAGEWGIFNYAITLVAFLALFVDFGISSILIRETAKTTDESYRSKIASTSFFIKITLVALGVLAVLFVAPHLTRIEEAKALFPIVAFILVFDSLREFGFSYTRALERMEWEAGLYIITNIAIVVSGFIFLHIHPTVRAFTFAYALGTGIGMIATLLALRRYFSNVIFHFSRSLIALIFRSAWPFAISGTLGMLMINADIVIIGWLRPAQDLGYYAAAQRFTQLLYLLPAVLSVSVLPSFSRLVHEHSPRFRAVLERILSLMFLVAIPLAVGGIIVAPYLVAFIFGADYLPGTTSLRILLLTLLVDFPAVFLSAAIFAHDKQKLLIAYSAIGGILNVVLDLALIPIFGIAGSAAATLAAQIASNVYLWYALRTIQPFAVLVHLKKILLGTVAMGCVTLFLVSLHWHVLSVIALSIPVYFGALYLMREKLLKEIKLTLVPPPVSAEPASSV